MGKQTLSSAAQAFRACRSRASLMVLSVPTPPRHAASSRLQELDSRLGDRAVRSLGTLLAGVLLVGAGATAARGGAPASTGPQVASVRLTAQVAPQKVAVTPSPAPVTKAVPKPAANKIVAKAVVHKAKPAPVKRWLPTGTGMWLHDYERSEGGSGKAVVARARAAGLSHLFVQTGSTRKGSIAGPTLRSILPATKGTGIRVIAWDFPKLHDPEADARRLAAAARFRCGGCPRVAAVAPDVETPAEGTKLTTSRVIRYYDELRRRLPRDVAVLATVPWPSEKRVGRYPYASTARRADAVLPMAYWYNRSPAIVTATSMTYLRQFRRPVMPVGQGYDGRLDAPYLAADPSPGKSVQSFLLTARRYGARSVSLWSWQTTGGQQWTALRKARPLYSRG
jgi:hypothetical protein